MKKFFTSLSAALVFTALLGLASCSKDNGKTLYIYNWTYYTPEDVVAQFEKDFGVKVKLDNYASNEEMYSKLRAGAKGYDIVVPSQDYASIMIEQGMVRELDQEKIPNRKYINPAIFEKATYDPEMKYAAPYYLGAAGISVNKTKVNWDYEKNWNIFADPRFKDHATMMDDMREVFADALVTLKYDLNSVNDAELDEAAKLITDSWNPNLVKFDAEGFGKSFASGDFWLCQGYAEVVYGEVPQEKWAETIDFFIPEEGGPCYLDSMMILKDAPHYELANEFINYIYNPENYAKFLDFFNFPDYIVPEAEQYMTTTPLYEASQMDNCELKFDLGEDLDKYNERWQKIRFGD
ncbi:MAG: extracellular solute-binding protein [Treponema sp.]|nr:extracellular solute-binding protein [Treponema sp.]